MTQFTQNYKSQLAVQFNRLNRDLMVADKPETWQPLASGRASWLAR